MFLTEEQETAVIKEYSGLMHHVVWKFEQKRAEKYDCHDDLFQECCIVLLNTVRMIEDLKDLKRDFPFKQMQNAMCRFILTFQTMSYPKRTSSFAQYMQNEARIRLAAKETRNSPQIRDAINVWEKVDDQMAVDSFVSGLSDDDAGLLNARYEGKRYKEVAQDAGRCAQWVSKRLKTLGGAYIDCVS